MKKLLFVIISVLSLASYLVYAEDVDFAILPEVKNVDTVTNDVKTISNADGANGKCSDLETVWDRYNCVAESEEESLGNQFASGALTWDSLLDYVVYLVKFLSQIGLFIGAASIIYSGYLYASDIFGGDANRGSDGLKYAIGGVVVISFSYAMIKILTSMFIE